MHFLTKRRATALMHVTDDPSVESWNSEERTPMTTMRTLPRFPPPQPPLLVIAILPFFSIRVELGSMANAMTIAAYRLAGSVVPSQDRNGRPD